MARGVLVDRRIRKRPSHLQFLRALHLFGFGLAIACVLFVVLAVLLEAREFIYSKSDLDITKTSHLVAARLQESGG
jgi:hypothetical protein